MASITIYGSEGHRYENGQQTASKNDDIKDYFLARIRLLVQSQRRGSRLVCFFRARTSASSRAEQFYAVYESSRSRSLFEDFVSDLQRTVEEEWGMQIDTQSDDTETYRSLTSAAATSPGNVAGDEFDHEVIRNRLEQGRQLAFGVPDVRSAVGLTKAYGSLDDSIRIGIAEEAQSRAQNHADLLFVPGSQYRGLEALNETEREMDEGRQALESQLVKRTVESINENVQQLRQDTSLSEGQIRQRVHRSVPLLKEPQSQGLDAAGPGNVGSDSGSNRRKLIAGGVLAVIVIALLAGGAAMWMGYGPGWIGGDDATDASFDIEVVDQSAESVNQGEIVDVDVEVSYAGVDNVTDDEREIRLEVLGQSSIRHTDTAEFGDDNSTTVTLELDTTDLEPGDHEFKVRASDGANDTGDVTVLGPEFSIEESSGLDASIGEGETFSPNVTVANVGDGDGDGLVTFAVENENGTLVNATSTVELNSGDDGAVRAELDTSDLEVGEYDVVVETPDDRATGNLTVEETHEVTISLEDEDGVAVSDATVEVDGQEEPVDGTGDAVFDLTDGTYDAIVAAEEFEDADEEFTVGGEDKEITVTLQSDTE